MNKRSGKQSTSPPLSSFTGTDDGVKASSSLQNPHNTRSSAKRQVIRQPQVNTRKPNNFKQRRVDNSTETMDTEVTVNISLLPTYNLADPEITQTTISADPSIADLYSTDQQAPAVQQNTDLSHMTTDDNFNSASNPVNTENTSDEHNASNDPADDQHMVLENADDSEEFTYSFNAQKLRFFINTPVSSMGLDKSSNKEIVNILNEFFIDHRASYTGRIIITDPRRERDNVSKIIVTFNNRKIVENFINIPLEGLNGAIFSECSLDYIKEVTSKRKSQFQ
ncbi:hypothetical protein C1645_834192 [Glomus cerebriforme]|uniref:Uncharacterized protein n=1 Tax=Glomus cerebriforme TaxID=658196 RepID=A0A397SB30_9GLOM|nr:hypothetical protein C1645_834192 [Glomus cerebriforme]